MAHHSVVRGIDKHTLTPIEELEPPQKVHQEDIRQIFKRDIKATVKRQAIARIAQERKANSMIGRTRSFFAHITLTLRALFGHEEPAPVFCVCSCPMGEGVEVDDPHFTEKLGNYSYRFCAHCISLIGFDEIRIRPSDYYFCWTDAPVEIARNVVEAIRQGEVEAYRPREDESEGAVRAGVEQLGVRLDGADDLTAQGEVPREVIRNAPAMGSHVATRETDCSVRHVDETDPHVSDSGDGRGAGFLVGFDPATVITIICTSCKTTLSSIDEAKEHTC